MDSSLGAFLSLFFESQPPLWAVLSCWLVILGIALFSLVRGADTFVVGAKHLGAKLGMSKFAIGVLIVGFGTSLPELASSVSAVLWGQTPIVIANVVGSNITNILLIVGFMTAFGGRIVIKRELIKTELPIFFIATVHFLAVVYDGTIDRIEALLLLGTFVAYLWYLFYEAEDVDNIRLSNGSNHVFDARSAAFILIGIIAVLLGAHYAVEMVINIATTFAVPIGLVSIAAIAIGTSLPELAVSLQAMRDGEQELAIGNIFGSNTFNILVVISIPTLITPLVADAVVMEFGLFIFAGASAILFVSGLAKQIMRWEGMMLLLFFVFFLVKLTAFIV